jgi:hypothetical protein
MAKNNSQKKGKDYERELAKEIEERLGGRVWRTPSSGGQWWEKADIAGKGNVLVDRFHIEAKRQERVNLEEAYGQALRGAGRDKIPLVVTRRSRDISMIYMTWDNFLSLMEELQNAP